ncbi:MAG: protein kinase [Planctomycetota bacterium]
MSEDQRFDELARQARDLQGPSRTEFFSSLSDEEAHQVEKILQSEESINLSSDQARGFDASSAEETLPEVEGYKVLQPIGQGGMGHVFMAEQHRPVKRRVALKVIRSDTPAKEILARFNAERQALAMMDHHNIAKVLDAGVTKDGRPYFAMELVKGVPITEYCDRSKLSPNERLELFVQTCRAIQHAHIKGIVHRDIKPSNILVTVIDGEPVSKVIDFGLAKATLIGLHSRPSRKIVRGVMTHLELWQMT